MRKVKYTLVYNRLNRLNSKGLAPIHIEVYFARNERRYVHTKIKIEPEYWDSKKRLISDKHKNSIQLNYDLKRKIDQIEAAEMELIAQGRNFTSKDLVIFMSGGNSGKMTFKDFCNDEFDHYSKNIMPSTVKVQKVSINHFNRLFPDIKLKDIKFQTIQEFDNKLYEEGYAVNTIGKCHRHVKKFLNLAINKGYMKYEQYPYKNFKIKQEETNRNPLTFEEIKRLEELDVTDFDYMQEVKDMFLFSCYTGLRISDLMNLKKSHLAFSNEGISIQLDRMIKVKRPVNLDLFILFSGKPEKIIKHYLKNNDKPIFSRFTEQQYRLEIKMLAKKAGITKDITPHTGRHTFGTHMAVISDGNLPLIMDLMGHSKADTTRIYIKLAEQMRNTQLRKLDWNKYNI